MRYMKKPFILSLIWGSLLLTGHCKAKAEEESEGAAKAQMRKRGVMDNFNEGLKYAGQMFGINTAADVANLVAKAFSTTTNRNKPNLMSLFQQGQLSQPQGTSEEEPSIQQQSSQEQQQAAQYYDRQEVLPDPPLKEEVAGGFDFNTAGIISSVLRMIGFDASKLGALAINALIMVAQMIGNTLMSTTKRKPVVTAVDGGRLYPPQKPVPGADVDTGPEALYEQHNEQQPRALRDGTPIDWYLQNPTKEMRSLLNDVNDRNLSEKVIHMIEDIEVENEQGACLKMLICKSSPFIWGMQNSLAKRFGKDDANEKRPEKDIGSAVETKAFNAEAFFTHLPSLLEYRQHGEECEQRYASYCNTTTFYQQHQQQLQRRQRSAQN